MAELDPRTLLQHREFVTAVAARLLPDEAEDIVQETYTRALARPPREPGALRAWLGRVARNLAIGRLRRRARLRRREQGAARPERVASAGEMCERLEAHRLVVEAVLRLEEPFRSTVIYRYYEDLSPAEIAAAQGVPLATVRSRLHRALERMRGGLDRAHGGDRAAWCLALLPLLGLSAGGAAGGGTTTLSLKGPVMKTKLVLTALALCAAGVAYVLWQSGDAKDAERNPAPRKNIEAPVTPSRPPPPQDVQVKGNGKAGAREAESGEPEVHVAAPAPETGPPPPPPPTGIVLGTVQLEGGALPLDVKVKLEGLGVPDFQPQEYPVMADGNFRFDGLPPGRYRAHVTHPEYAPHSFDLEITDLEGAGPFTVTLKPGGTLVVQVKGAGGAPMADEVISLQVHGEFLGGRTDATGELRLEHLAPGAYEVRRRSGSGEGALRMVNVEAGKEATVVFDVSCALAGTVFGPDGGPLAGAIVRLTPVDFGKEGYRNATARTDEDGRFRVQGFAPGEYTIGVQSLGKDRYVAEIERLEFKGGVVERELRVPPTWIAGVVTRADTGAPLSNREVQISAWKVEVENGKVKERTGALVMAFAGADGRYAFKGLAPGWYHVWVVAHVQGLREEWRIVDFNGGGALDHVDFALEAQKTGTLVLTVREPDGTPASNLMFSRITKEEKREDGGITTSSVSLNGKQTGDGVYRFVLEEGPHKLSIFRKGVYGQVEVSITAGGQTEQEVTLRAPKSGGG